MTGTCGATEMSCVCKLPPHDDGPHECGCQGSWEYVDGEFVVHRLPTAPWSEQMLAVLRGPAGVPESGREEAQETANEQDGIR